MTLLRSTYLIQVAIRVMVWDKNEPQVSNHNGNLWKSLEFSHFTFFKVYRLKHKGNQEIRRKKFIFLVLYMKSCLGHVRLVHYDRASSTDHLNAL